MERYECATCCYATNSYAKFLAHGKEHSMEKLPREAKIYIVTVTRDHYNYNDEPEGSSDEIVGVFSTRKKAEKFALSRDDSNIEEFTLDFVE